MYVLTFDTETTGLPKSRNASIEDSEQWPHIVQFSFLGYKTIEKTFLIIDFF